MAAPWIPDISGGMDTPQRLLAFRDATPPPDVSSGQRRMLQILSVEEQAGVGEGWGKEGRGNMESERGCSAEGERRARKQQRE